MKFHAIFLIGILAISLVGLFNFDNAFAEHVEYKTIEEKEKIDVKLFFVTSFDECTRDNWEALEGYSTITYYYLSKYNIVANRSIDCINEDRVKFAVDSSLSSHDLVIIFPDFWKSLEWLVFKGIWGHYMYPGSDKTIVTQALTFGFDSQESVWTLSHELSHFALEWYDYPRYVYGDAVHTRQAEYDACMARDPTGAYCRDLWELVESVVTADESRGIGKKYRVMEPLYSERYVPPSYSQTTNSGYPVSISVWTDKSTYQNGDIITITGKVNNFRANSDTTYYVKNYGMVKNVLEGKLTLNSRGEFTTSLVANDFPLLGEYQVRVSHSGIARQGITSFNYIDTPVFIFVSTDKSTYQRGDTITMKGKVNNFKENSKTWFQINGPSGILRAVELIDLNSRGEFSTSYPIDYIPTTGKHVLTINNNNNVAEITFNIFNPAPITPQQPSPIIQDVQGKVKFSDLQFFNSFNYPPANFVVGEKIKVKALIENLQNKEQSFAYIVQVQDASGITITVGSRAGSLSPGELRFPGWTWTPDAAGTHTVTVSLWTSRDDPTSLAQSLETRIYVQSKEPEPAPTLAPTLVPTPVSTPVPTQNDDLSEIIEENKKLREELERQGEQIDENKKLREELERQGEQIDELNEEVDWLKQIIQSIQGFFSSIFG